MRSMDVAADVSTAIALHCMLKILRPYQSRSSARTAILIAVLHPHTPGCHGTSRPCMASFWTSGLKLIPSHRFIVVAILCSLSTRVHVSQTYF